MCARLLVAGVLTGFLCSALTAEEPEELKAKYGTAGVEAAELLKGAAAAMDFETALKQIDAALAIEPACRAAWRRRGNVLAELGRDEEAAEACAKAWSMGPEAWDEIPVSAALGAGLALTRLRRNEEAQTWFTRAVLADPGDDAGLRARALAGLAVAHNNRRKFLAAGLALLLAPAKLGIVGPKEFFTEYRDQEGAQILRFTDDDPTPTPREPPRAIIEVALEGPSVSETIGQLLPDPKGRFVIAVPGHAPYYYVIETGAVLSVRRVAVRTKIISGCLAGGSLYFSYQPVGGPIAQVEPLTGKVLREIPSPRQMRSMAVFPRHQLLFYYDDYLVRGLNLRTGRRFATGIPGRMVAADPRGRWLFSCADAYSRKPGAGLLHYSLLGERVFLRAEGLKARQAGLFQSLVVRDGLILSGLNLTAAVRGKELMGPGAATRSIVVSPDGRWVVLVGAKGYDPRNKSRGSGVGVAVFNACSLEAPQAYFAVGGSPAGAAFNPVTAQLALVHPDGLRVCHLAAPDGAPSFSLKGSFEGTVAWSGRGDFLLLAKKGGGLLAFANPLEPAEEAFAGVWWKALDERRPPGLVPSYTFEQALATVADLRLRRSRDTCTKLLRSLLESGPIRPPCRWCHFLPYIKDRLLRDFLFEQTVVLDDGEDAGVAAARLAERLQKHRAFPPIEWLLARALSLTAQEDKALRLFADAARHDAGRTELTPLALRAMADVHARRKEGLPEIYCLALAAWADRSDRRVLDRLAPLLEKYAFSLQVGAFRTLRAALGAPLAPVALRPPDPDAPILPAAALLEKVVASVVLVKSPKGAGKGFCIGRRGVIATSRHIVRGSSAADVYPFVMEDGKLLRLDKCTGKVVLSSSETDVAVLKLTETPVSLVPLELLDGKAGTGGKAFVVRGLDVVAGTDVPALSEGAVDSECHRIGMHRYFRHAVPAGPTDSGGPLLNEKCQVVGMMTIRTGIDGTGYVIRAADIRELLPKP